MKFTRDESIASGSYSYYFKGTHGIGIKVLDNHFISFSKNQYKNKLKELKEAAYKEAQLLNVLEDSKIVPICYGVIEVELDEKPTYGILMQHIPYKELAEMEFPWKLLVNIIETAIEKFKKFNIVYKDFHEYNILYSKNKFYIIDFSPTHVKVVK